jgi:hypothetical protein
VAAKFDGHRCYWWWQHYRSEAPRREASQSKSAFPASGHSVSDREAIRRHLWKKKQGEEKPTNEGGNR